MQKKKSLDLSLILDLQNYQKSLLKWLGLKKGHQGQFFSDAQTAEGNQYQVEFDKYLVIVKPLIHRFAYATRRLSPLNYAFHCPLLSNKQISTLVNIYKPLSCFQISSNPKHMVLSTQQSNDLFSDFQPLTTLFRLDLSKAPSNEQFGFWGSTIPTPRMELTGQVIHGKGKGAKELGMPTANIRLSNTERLIDYPSGIYVVSFKFIDIPQNSLMHPLFSQPPPHYSHEPPDSITQQTVFKGVACLGTNPHYENLQYSRILQVYVCHNFKEQTFYGATVCVQFLHLIRFEGKFSTFETFLNAMHNDIYTALSIAI